MPFFVPIVVFVVFVTAVVSDVSCGWNETCCGGLCIHPQGQDAEASMRRPFTRAIAAFGTLAVAAACGGGSGSPSTPSPGPGSTSPVTITILGERGAQSFNPNPAPESIRFVWRNTDGLEHHIVANDGSFNTGVIAPGATSPAMSVAREGTNYHCTLHPAMVGSIRGSSGGPPPCSGPYC